MAGSASAVEGITAELEKVAGERKSLECELVRVAVPQGAQGGPITREAIDAFARAPRQRLPAIGTEERRLVLALLGFEAAVGSESDVQASIAVPTATHHCTNMGMTTWT